MDLGSIPSARIYIDSISNIGEMYGKRKDKKNKNKVKKDKKYEKKYDSLFLFSDINPSFGMKYK